MNARTSWSAKVDRRSASEAQVEAGVGDKIPLDDLLDARFDQDGRLSRGNRRRIAERLETRSPEMTTDDLERAVQKLALGLEAIERQGSTSRSAPARSPQLRGEEDYEGDERDDRRRDLVTHSLDRLEARLEALTRQLQQRASETRAGSRKPDDDRRPASPEQPPAAAAKPARPEPLALPPARPDPSLAVASGDADAQARAADARRESEEAEARQRAEAERVAEERREAEALAARRQAEMAEAARVQRLADETEKTARRAAEEAERERSRLASEQQLAARAAEDAGHRAELGEMRRQFAALDSRIGSLQESLDGNQIEPVRRELVQVLRHIEELGRDGQSIAGALDSLRQKLDDIESHADALRSEAGDRLHALHDRLAGMAERIIEVEAEVPGFDALRLNQTAILERFDMMEGLVHRLASPEDVLDKIESVRRLLPSVASQREVARIEEQILGLAERIDALPGDLNTQPSLERIEDQLQALAGDLAQARKSRQDGAAELHDRFLELSSTLHDLRDQDHTPDMAPLESRLAELAARLDADRRGSADSLSHIDRKLTALAAAVATHEDEAAVEALAGLTRKVDSVAEAIESQDAGGTRRDIEALDRKLDLLNQALAEQAEHLSRPQLQPLEDRLAHMQGQLEDLSQRARSSAAYFGPFARTLQEISERVSGGQDGAAEGSLAARLSVIEERLSSLVARGPDQRSPDMRGLHTQLDGIVSRLELLKGRSIDPARLTELFDRADAGIRNGLAAERFERIERRLEETGVPVERFDRLERRILESARTLPLDQLDRIESKIEAAARGDMPEERFAALERKLDDIAQASAGGRAVLNEDDLDDLRGGIVALRRELRSLPGLGEGEASLAATLKTISARLEALSDNPPATASELEAQIGRIAALLDDPGNNRLALAHIEGSLRSIEDRFEEARRSLAHRVPDPDAEAGPGDIGVVAGLARALSDDVSVLRDATESSERKTRDSLEAVQATLEAVVSRMAFLERDSDIGAAPAQERRPDEVHAATPVPSPAAAKPVEAAPADRVEAPAIMLETPREPAPGGLFSRLTSSQLLRRATGGRTESFSPDAEEDEDSADLPLEPGTDAPLDSALTGAPSSDTALMSGARRKPGAAANRVAALQPTPARPAAEPGEAEDFLAAARRAAQAAAAEAVEAEYGADGLRASGPLSGLRGVMRRRRGAVLAGVLAVAIAFAAVQVLRDRAARDGDSVALAPLPASTELASQAPVSTAASPGAVSVADPTASGAPVDLAATGQAASDSGPDANLVSTAAAPPADATSPIVTAMAPTNVEPQAEAPPAVAAPTAASPSAPVAAAVPTQETASLQSDTSPEPEQGSAAPAPVDSPKTTPAGLGQPLPPGLPAPIGPERLRKAAATDPAAAFEVASRYAEGRGAPQDLPAAVAWYARAAEAGLAPAQYRLGSIYEKGIGVPKDLGRAQEWYRRAAEAGNVKAMHNLAVLDAEGAGGKPDLEQAAQLFRQAAEHGVRDSQFNLAILHARGLGVPQDLVEAYKWFAIAAGSGDPESSKRRDIIAAALSETDLTKAKEAAASFQPQPLISQANDVMLPEGGWGEDTTNVQLQSENDRVALVQKLLAEKGFNPGPADGRLGAQTIQAIAAFQQKAGMPKTGQIDASLVAALQNRPT